MIGLTRRSLLLALGAVLCASPLRAQTPPVVSSITLPDGRSYLLVHDPKIKAAPVMVVLHGEGSDPRHVFETSDLCAQAVAAGFAVLLPLGVPLQTGGYGWGEAGLLEMHEIDFIDTAVADAETRYGFNGEKVYLLGEGRGGSLALAYAAERPNGLRAVAAINGTFNPEAHIVRGFVPVALVQETPEAILSFFARHAPRPLVALDGSYYDADLHAALIQIDAPCDWRAFEAILSFFLAQP